jgi:phage protein D
MSNSAKMPVFYIFLKRGGKNIDISEQIESFSFDDSTEKDNFLKLTVASKFSHTFEEKTEVAAGDIVMFYFGMIGGEMSATYTCIVKDIEYNYSQRVSIVLKALDKGNEVKKTYGGTNYKGNSAAEVVRKIAVKNGLKSKIEGGDWSLDNIVQANRNDLEFVKYLASLEPSGSHIAYIRNDTLYYVQEGNDSKSKKSFNYKDPNSGIIRFTSNYSESSNSAKSSNSSTAASFDPMQKKPVNAKVDANNETVETKTGTKTVVPSTFFNQNADIIGKKSIVAPITKTTDKKTQISADSDRKKKILKATLVVELMPLIEPNQVITIAGVFKRDIGNWLVVSITHDINGSGGISTISMTKNGTNTNKGVSAKKSNKTVGPDKPEAKRVIFNQNAERK